MRMVVGLGNPGPQYAETRHNLGFRVCDSLAAAMGAGFGREKFQSLVAEAGTSDDKLLLLKPQTFMNLSGQAVAAAVGFYQLEPESLLVVCDDFNLSLGRLRIRRSGSHGGHNGLRDIIERLGGETFARLRLGTGPLEGADPVAFCLTRFAPDQQALVGQMVEAAAQAAGVWLESGIDEAMNRFNARETAES